MTGSSTEARFVVFLGGIRSHNLETPEDHLMVDDFDPLRNHLAAADPDLQFVYFSFSLGRTLSAGSAPDKAWEIGSDLADREPRYAAVDTTDRSISKHVAALDWLVSELLFRCPEARIDLIGFSLGGIVATAWVAHAAVDDPAVAAIHRIVLVSSPVGGISPFGRMSSAPGVRQALGSYGIDFGRGLVFRDLARSSSTMRGLPAAIGKVDFASVENSRDFLVNGRRVAGQRLLPRRIHTIPLGWGVAATSFLRDESAYVADLGGWDRRLCTTHQHILRGFTPEIERARRHIVELVTTDGPVWAGRHRHDAAEHTT